MDYAPKDKGNLSHLLHNVLRQRRNQHHSLAGQLLFSLRIQVLPVDLQEPQIGELQKNLGIHFFAES